MKRLLCAAALALAASPVFAADVGVSISVGQPGFYGTIDIGDYHPRPRLIYSEPVIVHRARYDYQPIYLHAPPGHVKHWRKHCRSYGACGRPVYFVNSDWYERRYVPAWRERHREHWRDRRDWRDERRDDRRDWRHERRDERNDWRHGRDDDRRDHRDHERGRGRD